MFDVWFDGESVELVVMQRLVTKLQEAFKVPATEAAVLVNGKSCLLYTSPSPRDRSLSRMPSSA